MDQPYSSSLSSSCTYCTLIIFVPSARGRPCKTKHNRVSNVKRISKAKRSSSYKVCSTVDVGCGNHTSVSYTTQEMSTAWKASRHCSRMGSAKTSNRKHMLLRLCETMLSAQSKLPELRAKSPALCYLCRLPNRQDKPLSNSSGGPKCPEQIVKQHCLSQQITHPQPLLSQGVAPKMQEKS